ncbi:UNVERIFIED_CONTAM: hypothetical protein PYX00_010093 [Menopon gallinae]|uniref:DnaJ homolog subfamily C member 16 n=1 Tax=Menopon gallinae TaxID=328185 RepID=A0AAW2HEA9_9NEOP
MRLIVINMKWQLFYITLANIIIIIQGLKPLDDPYKILGVKKSATVQELRKAYKMLAKEWHPDKNDDPAAANKFVEITQAYELLTDPDRRKQFDNHGVINPDSNQRSRREYHFDEFDPFDDIVNFPYGFQFRSSDPDITLFHKLSITTRAFENKLMPKSYIMPHLILFYSDWCFSCLKIEPIWRRVIEELEPIGIEVATVHSAKEQLLAKKCGVGSVPALILLIDGKIYLYKESLHSFQNVVDFVRSKFPYKLIVNVNDQNVNSFLSGWHDNRIRALVFEKTEIIRLRYLLMAFYYRERVSFGFVRINAPDTVETQEKHKISPDADTLLLFNENINRPVASLSMTVIPVQTMKDVIHANKYLILPRLSSQKMMDSVCPVEWAKPRKRLCIVLISENTEDHDEPRQAMRQFAQESLYNSERVRFSYIYQERQQEFINSLLTGSPEETALNVVILWRRDTNHIKYEWLRGGWARSQNSPQWNETKERLDSTILKLLKTEETLTHEAVVKELIDEHAQGLLGKIITKFLIAADFIRENVGKDHLLAVVSVLSTVAFIVLGGYFMAYLVRLEEEKIKSCDAQDSENSRQNGKSNGGVSYTPQLRLHELRAEKYNGMVRLLKPGCRTIVLLVDEQSRNTLLPEFHKIVWPYRKNKTLMFGYMLIHRGIDWYKRLLTLSLPEPRELNINPRNCIGTVLSLNGHRKYFCMYHAKHPECFQSRGTKRMVKMTKSLGDGCNSNGKVGGFMGFDDTSDSDSDGNNVDIERGPKPVEVGRSTAVSEPFPETDPSVLRFRKTTSTAISYSKAIS